MSDLEKKIMVFSKQILNEAESRKNKTAEKINAKKASAIEKKEIELLSDAYEDIQKAVAKYSKQSNEHILKIELELKKEVIKKREDIINEVFNKAKTRLEEFTVSADYKEWLINKAKEAASEIGSGEIRIMPRDMKFKDDIEKELPDFIVL